MKQNNIITKVTIEFYTQASYEEINKFVDKLSDQIEKDLSSTSWGGDNQLDILIDKDKPLESGIDNDTLAYFGFTEYNYN
jgi:hypothetical protein